MPLDTPTAWKKGGKGGGEGYQTLGSIWCAVSHRHLKGGEQQRKFQEVGVPVVNFLEVKELIAYMTGAKSDSDMIDVQARTQTLLSKDRLGSSAPGGPVRKRELKLNEKLLKKIEEEKQMTVNEFLIERELKLENRNTVL